MPYSHRSIFPTSQDRYLCIQGRIYSSSKPSPKFAQIITQDNGSRRFAFLQGLLSETRQNYIHLCEVKVVDRRKCLHTFYIAFKNDKRLPLNKSVKTLTNVNWKGNIVILRGAVEIGDGIVSMRRNDAKLADFALKKTLLHLRQQARLRIPSNLEFHM